MTTPFPSPSPARSALIDDCQHMATSAMGIAADLARLAEQECAGINTSEVHRRIYDSHSEERLRFLGFVLKDKITVLREFNTAYIAITADELRQYHSKTGDTEGLVNFALSIEGMIDGLCQNFLIGPPSFKRNQAIQAVFDLLDAIYPDLQAAS